jgi:8-amino-7-oxononanoate synthase
MAADARVIDYVRHTSRQFIFSASIPPIQLRRPLTAAALPARHPERVEALQDNARYMRKCLDERKFKDGTRNGECVPIIRSTPTRSYVLTAA